MSKRFVTIIAPLLGLLLATVPVYAGGADPRDMPAEQPAVRETVTATPAQTSSAVSKARQAVAPAVAPAPVGTPRPQAPAAAGTVPRTAGSDSWLLSSGTGCEPLANVGSRVKVGSFKTPQEFAHKMQQRGYQAFVLDIGDVRDQKIRVKVPDQDLDLVFVKAGLCP